MTVLPEPHLRYAADVEDRVAEAMERRRLASARDSISDVSVISIDGKRGSGKTTVLEYTCTKLADKHVVIDAVRPEMFSTRDTTLGSVIVRLLEMVRGGGNERRPSSDALSARFISAAKQAALVGERNETASDYTEKLDDLLDSHLRSNVLTSGFEEQWYRIVDEALGILAPSDEAFLIVPIDDADLAPELISRTLIDLRLLVSHPRVLCIVALDGQEARRAMAERYLKNYPHLVDLHSSRALDLSGVLEAVDGQLIKALPPRFSVELRELSPRDRLKFVPLDVVGDPRPLRELLRMFPLSKADEENGKRVEATLADYFTFAGEELEPTEFADMLPAAPRLLSALYSALSRLAGTESSRSDEAHRVRAALEAILKSQEATSYTADESNYISLTNWYESYASASLDMTRLEQRQPPPRETIYFEPSVQSISRGESGSDVQVMSLRSTNLWRQESRVFVAQLPAGIQLSMLLLQDIGLTYNLFHLQVVGRRFLQGGVNGPGALRIFDGSRTSDDDYFLHPPWDGHLDYLHVFRSWNSIFSKLRGKESEIDPATAALLLSILWICLHAKVQQDRSGRSAWDFARQFANDFTSYLSMNKTQLRELLRSNLHAAASVYISTLGRRDQRETDFRDWFESYVPFSMVPGLQHEWVLREFYKIRRSLLGEAGRLSAANLLFTRLATQRVERSISEPWVANVIAGMDYVRAGSGRDLLARHRSQVVRQGGFDSVGLSLDDVYVALMDYLDARIT